VIPTYQRRDIVVRTVQALERQVMRDFDVVVVVDGSTDGTAAALRRLQVSFPLTVLENDNAGASVARNAGAAASSGEVLVFLDDDMEARSDLLAEHDRSHREGADVVLGHLPLHPESPSTLLSQGVGRWAERRRERLAAADTTLPVSELNTGQMSISREAFDALGGFDVEFTRNGLYGGEDLDFGYRARRSGLRIVFNPAAVTYQYYAVDPATYTRRTRDAGRAAQELKIKHPELTQDLSGGREFVSRRSRWVLGALGAMPAAVSWPLRVLAAHRVRTHHQDERTYRLFFGLQTMEYHRGARQARRDLHTGEAVVLAYHSISDLHDDPLLAEYGVPPQRFAEQLDCLIRHGWRFLTLETMIRALGGDTQLPARSALLTFDDGYADLLTAAQPILAEREIPFVVFAVSDRLGGSNDWDRTVGGGRLTLLDEMKLRALIEGGGVVGSHGASHRRLVDLDPSELERELQGSAARLASVDGARPIAFSYPYGVWSPEVREAVSAAGYVVGFTVRPGVVRRGSDRYALPRIEVLASDTPAVLRLKLATAGWPDPLRRKLLDGFRALRARWRLPLPADLPIGD
jgi:peptidoglycan/xylan/chitin deacetylase (PgdA/CDA1 family)/GT2 family glycosyltransferase